MSKTMNKTNLTECKFKAHLAEVILSGCRTYSEVWYSDKLILAGYKLKMAESDEFLDPIGKDFGLRNLIADYMINTGNPEGQNSIIPMFPTVNVRRKVILNGVKAKSGAASFATGEYNHEFLRALSKKILKRKDNQLKKDFRLFSSSIDRGVYDAIKFHYDPSMDMEIESSPFIQSLRKSLFNDNQLSQK